MIEVMLCGVLKCPVCGNAMYNDSITETVQCLNLRCSNAEIKYKSPRVKLERADGTP